jgi:hypothetical protein
MNSKSKLLGILTAGAIGIGSVFPSISYSDIIYYGNGVKNKETPAYIVMDEIKKSSKQYQNLPSQNDANYHKAVQKLEETIYSAIIKVAQENGYDVIVEKGEPEITNYVNASQKVIAEVKKAEK